MRDLIASAMKPRSTPLYVLTIGCPANVSSAILIEPKIKEKIVVVWLGGTTHEWPSAREFNLKQDLHASRVLFDSGVPLVQIPTKNVAEHLRTTLPEGGTLPQRTFPAGRLSVRSVRRILQGPHQGQPAALSMVEGHLGYLDRGLDHQPGLDSLGARPQPAVDRRLPLAEATGGT